MAELLLEHGADLNSRDIEGWTPLHAAAATGNVQLISILVDSGANLVAINHDDKMPVDVAADSDIKYILQQKMTEAGMIVFSPWIQHTCTYLRHVSPTQAFSIEFPLMWEQGESVSFDVWL